MTDADRLRKYLSVLQGGTVMDTDVIEEDDGFDFIQDFQALVIKATDGTLYQIEVLSDPEGNGPGHLDINKL